jgi:hypothetical protein
MHNYTANFVQFIKIPINPTAGSLLTMYLESFANYLKPVNATVYPPKRQWYKPSQGPGLKSVILATQ